MQQRHDCFKTIVAVLAAVIKQRLWTASSINPKFQPIRQDPLFCARVLFYLVFLFFYTPAFFFFKEVLDELRACAYGWPVYPDVKRKFIIFFDTSRHLSPR